MFSGLGTALVTPFDKNDEVDYDSLTKIVENQIENGLDYLVVQGTTGESVTLNNDEKSNVLKHIAQVNNNRIPLVLGIGGNNTQAIIEYYKGVDKNLFQGILSVSPYYNKPTQEGIYQHYKNLSKVFEHPIILYNVPGRTSSNISAETTLRLANDFDNIIAIKEASGDLEQIMSIIKRRPTGFLVISGDDALALPHMLVGGDGLISVISNAYPKYLSNIIHNAMNGNIEETKKEFYKIFDMIPLLFQEGNPAGVKTLMSIQKLCDNYVRLPLVKSTDSLVNQISNQHKLIHD